MIDPNVSVSTCLHKARYSSRTLARDGAARARRRYGVTLYVYTCDRTPRHFHLTHFPPRRYS